MLVVLAMAACSDNGTDPIVTGDHVVADVVPEVGEDAGGDAFPTDKKAPDDVVPDQEPGAEIPPDLLPGEPPPDVQTPGEFGDPCETDADCASGPCVPTPEGMVCSLGGCIEMCPEGWDCVGVVGTSGEVTCIPQDLTLCQPCQASAQCLPTGFNVGDEYAACMDYGVEGTYCALPCQSDAQCPAGYKCDDWYDVDGVAFQGCRRKTGACECNFYGVSFGAATNCTLGNEFGYCTGQRHCQEDGTLGACEGTPAAAESCNGLDDDCDEKVDEGLDLGECTMESGFGVCTGPILCQDGAEVCAAKMPAEEICDKEDNDCDGEVDEGFLDGNGNGILDCLEEDSDGDGISDYEDNCMDVANEGQENADGDAHGDACDDDDDNDTVLDEDDCDPLDPLISPLADELCNGFDDDCDGEIDEGYPDSNGDGVMDCVEPDTDKDAVFDYEDNCIDVPNPGQQNFDGDELGDACDPDDDNDTYPDEQDCAPADPATNPSADEKCDGKDNDCDGAKDEGFPDLNKNGVADCIETIDEDGDGFLDAEDCCPADPQCYPGAPEQCDGKDNDCDAAVDEDLGTTSCGQGVCANTMASCVDGQLQECKPLDAAVAEGCDGLDNDCDGATDEELAPLTCGLGICVNTVAACADGLPQECKPLEVGVAEVCDGLDNDCDGAADEELGASTCGQGVCVNTVDNCAGGQPQECKPLEAAVAETCDGLDNDCDGAVDEEQGTTTCGNGICVNTVDNCVGGQPQQCKPLEVAVAEACDGKDNDCDGTADEELGATSCGQGVCANTVENCANGLPQECLPLDAVTAETCDQKDNDCDGQVDEGTACDTCTPQTYGNHLYLFCSKTRSWAEARARCIAEKMDLTSIGSAAEDLWLFNTAKAQVNTNVWWCGFSDQSVEGTFVWASGEPVVFTHWWTGEPNNYSGNEDCTSLVAYGNQQAWNDMPCATNAPYVCEDGDADKDGTSDQLDDDDDNDGSKDADDCQPLNAAISPLAKEICNGADENCNGQNDEGFGTLTCGQGVCVNTVSECVGGKPQVCVPLDVATKELCDSIDNNCNGTIDDPGADGCANFYVDADGDGFGAGEASCLCKSVAPYVVSKAGDCNDGDAKVNPDAKEICADKIDNDCNPATTCFEVVQGDQKWPINVIDGTKTAVAAYSYGNPGGSSANTGLELADHAQFILYREPTGSVYLVIILDKVQSGSGGSASVTVEGLQGANLVLSDDANEASIDVATGVAKATWTWATCCTDGAIFGPVGCDGAPFELKVSLNVVSGITAAVVRNGQAATVKVPDMKAPFVIKGVSDPAPAPPAQVYPSCKAILDAGASKGDGIYWVDPDGGDVANAVQTLCDMTTNGGGWTMCGKFDRDNVWALGYVPAGFGRTALNAHKMAAVGGFCSQASSIDCRPFIAAGGKQLLNAGTNAEAMTWAAARIIDLPKEVKADPTNLWDITKDEDGIGDCMMAAIVTRDAAGVDLGNKDGTASLGLRAALIGDGALWTNQGRTGAAFSNAGGTTGNAPCDTTTQDTVYWAWMDEAGKLDDHNCAGTSSLLQLGTGCKQASNWTGKPTYRYNLLFVR
jgi:hypothetical protein